jgi:hypothetical protein
VAKTKYPVVHYKQKGSVKVVGRVHTYFFINDITECFDTDGTHSPVINELKILGLLFADD